MAYVLPLGWAMNKLRPILLVLTAVAALSFAHPARANLITNGGFEDGGGAFFGWAHRAEFSTPDSSSIRATMRH
jgi:hypothetical protein